MRSLSNGTILEVWERARESHPLERALTILAAAHPERSRRELAELRVGARDSMLLGVRTGTFGNRLEACVGCPACASSLEFETTVADLVGKAPPPRRRDLHLAESDFELRFRVPNSFDLAEAVRQPTPARAHSALVQACVLELTRADRPAESSTLTDCELELLGEALLQADPLAEITFDVACPACSHQWSAPFDVNSYLWSEICRRARQLLCEVDALARAYSWSESEILSLTEARRTLYLELLEAR